MELIFLEQKNKDYLKEIVNTDPEFKLNARFMSRNVLLVVGESECVIKIKDGQVADILFNPFWEPWDYAIRGKVDAWTKMFQPVPPPFFDNLWTAMQRDNLRLEGDLEVAFSHFGALVRLIEIFKQAQNEISR